MRGLFFIFVSATAMAVLIFTMVTILVFTSVVVGFSFEVLIILVDKHPKRPFISHRQGFTVERIISDCPKET